MKIKSYRIIVTTVLGALVIGFVLVTALYSQPLDFSFEQYHTQMLDNEALLSAGLMRTSEIVLTREIAEQTTRLVPMGEWYAAQGVTPTNKVGEPDQPVFIMAMYGDFVWGQGEEPGTFLTTPSFTIAINAITGEPLGYTGMFQDPYLIEDIDVKSFPTPAKVDMPVEIKPEESNAAGDGSILLPPPPTD